MIIAPIKAQNLTLEEFLQLPETQPASEYIDGKIIQKTMPQGKHSKLQGKLISAINNLVENSKIALALPELRCSFGDRSIVPDITVFAWSRIPVDEDGEIANIFPKHPDWVIEILSPDQSQTKVTKNILHCLEHGTKMGWLIIPEEKSVIIYPQQKQPEVIENEPEILLVPELVGNLNLTLGELFSWLKLR